MYNYMDVVTYYLANHPTIVNFRWSHAQSWGSTWYFLISSLSLYALLSLTLHSLLLLLRRRRPIPLGPVPALHSLSMSLLSLLIFFGILLSSLYEIRESRWLWRRTRTTPLQWLICFPLGTRSTGRVFFWSYQFYLLQFVHSLRTFFLILERKTSVLDRVFVHSALVCMSFVWLEFSQSFQVVGILSATMAQVVVFGCRFWDRGGTCSFKVVLGCQAGLFGLNLVCHLGMLGFHFSRGGCNGIGAWLFNSVLNGALLIVFLKFYVKREISMRRVNKGGLLLEQQDLPPAAAANNMNIKGQ